MKAKYISESFSLWTKITDRTEHAIRSGSLHSVPTESLFLEDDGIQFFVRILKVLSLKAEAKKREIEIAKSTGKTVNPFLPYEEDLFVSDISSTHLCLLNKYNVVKYHLLIVTREFEDQEMLMTLEDFEAMWLCMAQFDSLSFYNGGTVAGASQSHKHLQLIPLPLTPKEPKVPIEPVFESVTYHNLIGAASRLPFVHAFIRLNPAWINSPTEAAKKTFDCYNDMLNFVGIKDIGNGRQSGPYNFIATKDWMFLVPRSEEFYRSISVNSLGFAGTLLVKNEEELKLLKKLGPMNLLRSVAVAEQ